MKKLFLILLMALSLTACQNQTSATDDVNACDFGDDDCESEVRADEGLIWDKLTLKESLDHLDETVILFYSFTDCPYCLEARPILEEVTKGSDIPIYYVDVKREERDSGNADYETLFNHFKDALNKEGYDKIYMPCVIFLKEGELVGLHIGTVDGHDPSVAKMDEDQSIELKNIYQAFYDEMV